MIIKDEVVEKQSIGMCPPMVASRVHGVKESGFPHPPLAKARLCTKPSKSCGSELRISAQDLVKLEWTNPVDPEEDVSSSTATRYDFNGNVMSASCEENEEYKSELYHHGREPGNPGYTLEELFHLTQSGFQAQKALALKALGCIAEKSASKGRKSRREAHRVLIGEWKCHLRFSVACSDTSLNVRSSAWTSLLQLIETMDKECGCVVSDLASIPEFFKALDKQNVDSVKVFLYMINALQACAEEELNQVQEILTETVIEAAERFELDPSIFECGAPQAGELLTQMITEEEAPAAEVIATLCDRIACNSSEPLTTEDVELFASLLKKLRPTIPFFAIGQVDEFSWTSRCSMCAQALIQFAGHTKVSVFLAKVCFLFTCSLFPLECRAAVWTNTDLIFNISRLVALDDTNIFLLGNQEKLDFAFTDIGEVDRESALVVRGIKNACKKFLETDPTQESRFMLTTAESIVKHLGNK